MTLRVRHFKRTRLPWFFHSVSQFLRFGFLALRSRFISEPLALDPAQGAFGARGIVNAEANTVGITEVKFGEIAVKMLLAAMLINANHAAFENAVIALNGVGVDLV